MTEDQPGRFREQVRKQHILCKMFEIKAGTLVCTTMGFCFELPSCFAFLHPTFSLEVTRPDISGKWTITQPRKPKASRRSFKRSHGNHCMLHREPNTSTLHRLKMRRCVQAGPKGKWKQDQANSSGYMMGHSYRVPMKKKALTPRQE